MAVSASFLAYVGEVLAPIGEITIKRMFGAAGIYHGGLFFAVVDDDTLYLKVDAENREAFEAAGMTPATMAKKDGSVLEMNFYTAPDGVFEDEDELARWTGLALDAARRAAAKKIRRARKPSA